MKAMIVEQGVINLDEVRKASSDNKLSHVMSLGTLYQALKHSEHIDSEHDEMTVQRIIWYVSNYLVGYAEQGLLNYTDVLDSGSCGMATVYTKPSTSLLNAYCDAAKSLKKNANYSDNINLRVVYSAIVRQIRKIGHDSSKKDPAAVLDAMKTVLDALEEPEAEE